MEVYKSTVDSWEIAEVDKAKLSVAGSRIQMTGQLAGETFMQPGRRRKSCTACRY